MGFFINRENDWLREKLHDVAGIALLLRRHASHATSSAHDVMQEAADALEAQAAELARLREALTKINVGDGWAAQIARAALAQKGGE